MLDDTVPIRIPSMIKKCESCGMPIGDKKELHGAGDLNNPYCKYCTDEKGRLLPKEVIRENMISHVMKIGMFKTRREAEFFVDNKMAAQPAWQKTAKKNKVL